MKTQLFFMKSDLVSLLHSERGSVRRMLLLVAMMLTIGTSALLAQNKTITGKIQDNSGEVLLGVTILEKGTGNGTVTDLEGSYSLNVADNAVILVQFIGMTSQEMVVTGKQVINVTLESSAIGLDEVVAIGYTTRKKGELTGSISTVDSETIKRSGNKDLAKSLSGKVPGLIVSDRGGYPGGEGDVQLLIRGKSTLGNNSPLILIDGMAATSFSHLSPQDIQSLTVLKDGAAAIYGARAANGVILITTNRGKTGKPQVNLTSSYTRSSFSAQPELMSSEQYAIYENDMADRNGIASPYSDGDIAKYAAGNDPLYPSTDWSDLTFADYSPELRATLSISGGSDRVNYFVSGDYLNQIGMYESGDLKFKQYQVRSNIDIKVWENFKVGVDLSARKGETQEPGVNESFIYKHIYTNEPTEVGYYENGLAGWGGENGANPAVMSSAESGTVNRTRTNLTSKFSFDWNLNELTEGLKVKGFAGTRNNSYDEKSWYTPWTVSQYQPATDEYISSQGFSQYGKESILRETYWEYNELMLNATVHYNRTFDEHTVRGFAGYEQTTSDQRSFWAQKKDFPSADHPELFAGSDEGQQSYGTSYEWARVNYFASLSYDYAKKYFIDLTIRRDGSSNFGEGNKFGTFPSVGISWSIADESFMDFSDNWLDALKLRSSWAIMGNDRIDGFQYLTRYDYSGNTNVRYPNYYIFGTPGARTNGYTSSNVPNEDITWETADMRNLGLSFSMFENRLSGDLNYFYQRREGILIQRNASIPDAAGLTLPEENLGKVDNYGYEMQLGWHDKIGDVSYNVGFNFTQAKNEVVYMDEAADVPEWLREEGYSMDSYVIMPTDGIFRDQAAVDATTVKLNGTVEGEIKYLDTNEDGKITTDDRVRKHSSNVPEIQYGIMGGISYKGFDFNFLFQGQAQAEVLVYFDQSGSKPSYVFDQRWTPENRGANYPRAFGQDDQFSGSLTGSSAANDDPLFADLYLRDASFLRLKEVELSYTFNDDAISFGDLKVFARGNNLLTMFSDIYDLGLDPEAASYNNFRGSTYPSLKSYSVGFNLSF